MINSSRCVGLLSLFCLATLSFGPGCNSQRGGDNYREFSEVEENGQTETSGTSETQKTFPEKLDPLQAPRPEMLVASAGSPSGTNENGELVPLKAVKPVFGESSRDVQKNIENKVSTTQEPREIKVLVKEPSFRKEDGAYRVSYDDLDLLKVLNMEPVPVDAVSYFPDWLTDLDGERIRIRGFMYPPFRETDLDLFILARDNQICCFGRNPKIYDLITVEMKEGVTTDYILNRPFDVVGTFHIRPDVDGDELFNLYEISDAIVVDN